MTDDGSDNLQSTQFHYHLELTPAQLKLTHTALRSLLDDFGHDQSEVLRRSTRCSTSSPTSMRSAPSSSSQEIERQLKVKDATGDEPPTAA